MAEIVPNEELRALVLRMYRLLESGDVEGLENIYSVSPSLLVVGSDAAEWHTGADAVNILFAQLREAPSFTVTTSGLTAFSCGEVGWIADKPRFRYGDGTEQEFRHTATLALERGHWRIVQWHASLPVSNVLRLTTGIEQLVGVVRTDRPSVDTSAAPDGTVTIAFSDIESSSVLLDRLGDADFVRLLAWHDRLVHESVELHRGFVVKSQGDGFMLAFPSAASALRASLDLRERISPGFGGVPLRVRVGLHVGEAMRHADDFYGRTVVIAARISALALGGEILASSLVHGLVQGLGTFTFGPPRIVTLKGLDGTFDVYPVIA